MGLVSTQQILFPVILMKMFLIISEKKIDLLVLVTSINLCNLGNDEKDALQERTAILRDRGAFSSNIRCIG